MLPLLLLLHQRSCCPHHHHLLLLLPRGTVPPWYPSPWVELGLHPLLPLLLLLLPPSRRASLHPLLAALLLGQGQGWRAPAPPCQDHLLQRLGWATPYQLGRALLPDQKVVRRLAWVCPKCPPPVASCSRLPPNWPLHHPRLRLPAASSAALWGWAWLLLLLPCLPLLLLLLLLLLRGSLLHAHWRLQLLAGLVVWSNRPRKALHHQSCLHLLLLLLALRRHCCRHWLLLLLRRRRRRRPLLRGAGG
jgi:hypothetical protein